MDVLLINGIEHRVPFQSERSAYWKVSDTVTDKILYKIRKTEPNAEAIAMRALRKFQSRGYLVSFA